MIPISLRMYEQDKDAFSKSVGGSFARYGFAVIADHGVPDTFVDATRTAAKDFFALPQKVKDRYVIPSGAGQRGYTPFGIETAKGAQRPDLKEFWHVGRSIPPGHPLVGTLPENVIVTEIAGFDDATCELFRELDSLGLKILSAVARYLELPDDFFDGKVGMGNSILRLLHYPPLGEGARGLRAEAHEDINVITLLLGAEEAGLQLLDRNGQWLDVNPAPGCVVVNIGDMLQRLTNHVLPSTTHRVANPSAERAGHSRYAIPFFQHFTSDYLIETLPSCISDACPDRYPEPITAGDYLRERLEEIRLL